MTAPSSAELGRLLYGIVNDPARTGLRTPEFYADVAKRFIDQARLVSLAEAQDWENRAQERGIRAEERAREEVREARARFDAATLTVRQDLAAMLRSRANNPHYVTGNQRRHGVLLAAEWLDPAPKDGSQ